MVLIVLLKNKRERRTERLKGRILIINYRQWFVDQINCSD